MAQPFPSNGDPTMPHPDNAPQFDDLERLALVTAAEVVEAVRKVTYR